MHSHGATINQLFILNIEFKEFLHLNVTHTEPKVFVIYHPHDQLCYDYHQRQQPCVVTMWGPVFT